ncbi:MAG: glycosyl hydrolase, partial [Acidobacteriota bacterium]
PVLYQLADAQKADAFLFAPEDAYRRAGGGGGQFPSTATVGANPPNGVVVNYYLKQKEAREVVIEFLDASGKTVRKFTKRADGPGGAPSEAPAGGGFGGRGGGDAPVTAGAGLNTFVWNYRLPNATTLPGLILWGGSLTGPRVTPGNYQVRLSLGGKVVSTEPFALKADPRLTITQEDFVKQYEFLQKISAKISEIHAAILELRDIRTQLENMSRRLKSPENKDLIDKARDINKKLTDIEETLFQTKIRSGQDALNFPIKLNNKLAALSSSVDSSDDAPTAQAYAVFADLQGQVEAQLAVFSKLKSEDIADFNKQFNAKGLPVITSGK